MSEAFITATAAVLPNAPVDNESIEAILGQIGDRPSLARPIIQRKNGIKNRHYAIDPASGLPTHTNASLTAEAVRALAQDSGFALSDLRCLASGTSMPDQTLPGHAVMVHGELANCACEVISAAGACVSGLAALKYAWLAVKAKDSENAIATGSELMSPLLRAEHFSEENLARVAALETYPNIAFEKDFLRWMLSDGAGAFLIEPRPRAGQANLRIDWIDITSAAHRLPICMYAGGDRDAKGKLIGWTRFPPKQWAEESIFALKQNVRLLDRHVVEATLETPLSALVAQHNLKAEEIDWFLPHMSSNYFRQPIADALVRAGLPIPQERWFTNLETKGNTGSASVYIMVDELRRNGLLTPGKRLLCFVPESARFTGGFMHLTAV